MSKKNCRKILATSALPYANGPIHLGHLVEYIQTDIWVRFQRMRGHEIYYVCADDAHGTPIMLRAEKEGISTQALIDRVWEEHQRDFSHFNISFDRYYTTDSQENKALSEQFYHALQAQGLIDTRDVKQAFDPVKQMFLPDRFVKGGCPKCAAEDQYGDSCEKCGATYSPTDLKNAYSVVSGAAPIEKTSTHYFFKLSDPKCEAFLREWVGQLDQIEAVRKMQEWLGEEGESKLRDWDISRDAPYFGFEIPGAPGKYFYVWLDAPIGYYASFQKLCQERGLDFNAWVQAQADVEQYHFIGKDILYFHALFWPAMLKFAGYHTPTNVFAHGFLTIDGHKMSKSRGSFITAQSYIEKGLHPEWLRYYFAVKLNASMGDIDFQSEDFVSRINSDLIGKYINIASRSANFLHKIFNGKINKNAMNNELLQRLRFKSEAIAQYYEEREYSKAIRCIMEEVDKINSYIDENKPWVLAKLPEKINNLHEVCSISIEAFRILTLYLKPVLPESAKKIEDFLNISPLHWNDINKTLSEENIISPYEHLMGRIELKTVQSLFPH